MGWIDELLVKYPQAKYNDFKELVEYAQKFGEEATRTKLNSMKDTQSVNRLINDGLKYLSPHLDKAVDNTFSVLQKQFDLEHTPRARPAVENNPDLKQQATASQSRQLKQAAWAKAIEYSADPKARDSQVANDIVNNPKDFIPLFMEQAVKAEFQNRLENKLKNQMKMTPARPAPRNTKTDDQK